MHVKVLEEDIDRKAILNEVDHILKRLNLNWKKVDQIGLQAHKPNLDPIDYWSKTLGKVTEIEYPETYYKYPIWDTPLINRFMDKYGLVRTRIMKSNPRTCLSLHRDLSKRIHIPLFTNDNCFMVIDDQVYRMPPNNIYLADTTQPHTAVNASFEPRAHIVGCLY
jgi:aspartyl/asparaginyl beta-hydroxylase (cupin superfamily)